MPLKFIDLFAGCGGMTLGFQNAGFEAVAAFDNWEPAIDVYRANFGHDVHKIDLGNWQESLGILNAYQFDMIIGGPPCQDFSHAGKRDENLGRADLIVSFAQIVARTKPKWFVMENVDRTVKSQRYRRAGEILRDAGYSLTQRILDANQFGNLYEALLNVLLILSHFRGLGSALHRKLTAYATVPRIVGRTVKSHLILPQANSLCYRVALLIITRQKFYTPVKRRLNYALFDCYFHNLSIVLVYPINDHGTKC